LYSTYVSTLWLRPRKKDLFLYLGGDLGDGVGVASDGAGLPPVPHAPHAPEKRVRYKTKVVVFVHVLLV
jgi:hypothetical protein